MDNYQKECEFHWDNRHHTACVGVIDPTGNLPRGRVFVPGLTKDSCGNSDKIIITRWPCTEVQDIQLLAPVLTKPAEMTIKEWRFLNSLPFGEFNTPP